MTELNWFNIRSFASFSTSDALDTTCRLVSVDEIGVLLYSGEDYVNSLSGSLNII